MNEAHKKLNLNKKIIEVNGKYATEFNCGDIIKFFNYVANHFVWLSHNILYAISKKKLKNI